jgi:hypothetical protein
MAEQKKNPTASAAPAPKGKEAAAAPAAEKAKGMSEETKAKLAARVEARKAAKANVLEYLKQFDLTKADEKKLHDEIMLFVGATARSSGTRATPLSPTSALKDALVGAGAKGLSETDIFKLFRIGRPEMIIKMRILIQRAKKPEDRVWVSFTEGKTPTDDGIYKVLATGKDAPKDWTGYTPEQAEAL